MNKKIAVLILALVLILSLVVIIVEIPMPVRAGTIYVDDDYGSEDATHKMTIQAAVNAAQPGDTVYVYSGIYYENVVIDKTINITGENKETTIIDGLGNPEIVTIEASYVNLSRFTIQNGDYGCWIGPSNNSKMNDNKICNITDIGVVLVGLNHTIDGNMFFNTSKAIRFTFNSKYNLAKNNYIYNSPRGIIIDGDYHLLKNNILDNLSIGGIGIIGSFNILENNIISNIGGVGIELLNIGTNNNILINNTVNNTTNGLIIWYSAENVTVENCSFTNSKNESVILHKIHNCTFINSTLENSGTYDIILSSADAKLLNTTFNKTRVFFVDNSSTLTIQWYLHVNLTDYVGNPVPNAQIKIEDSNNSSNEEFFTTDSNGYLRWLITTEYNEQDIDGDTIGEKTYHTPHKIVAWNDTLVGYAQPIMNESKTVTILLYNGTLMDLEPGWNLISLPRIQSDTNLQTVLQSIEGQYDAVQWYNATDNNDPWKHNHISKPSYLNDLEDINHTMGLWVHVTDPGGTTLVVFGNVLTSAQNITLYPGWNLVGYPSTTDKTRTLALNNLFFDTDVDTIWTYNATTQKWKEITVSDNFEVGRGYWIHAKNKVTWIIPL